MNARRAAYQEAIAKATGNRDWAWCVEAYMRLERGTLDGLTGGTFDILARSCQRDVDFAPDVAIDLAESYGIRNEI